MAADKPTETLTQECENPDCGKIVKYDVASDEPRDAIPLPPGWVYWRGKVLCLNCKTLPQDDAA